MEIRVGVVSDRGLNPRRPVNQDSYLSLPSRGVFAVFDGVGGQRAGEIASRLAAESVEEYFARESDLSPKELIERAIRFANRDVYEMAEADPNCKTMATTIALLHLNGKQATIAHVGDSRVYRFEDGYFYRETIDHTNYNDDLRAGMSPQQRGGNVINRALGAEPNVDVELKMVPLNDGAKFLLCSDGIYRHMEDEEIALVLALNKEPQAAADELQKIVMERGANDNLTALVVQVGRARAGRVMGIVDALSEYTNPRPAQAKAANPSVTQGQPARRTGAIANSAPSKGRFEVEFNPRTKRLESLDENGNSTTSAKASPYPEEDSKPQSKFVIWLLVWIVTVAGAFYGGLKLSDFWQKSPSKQVTDTAAQLRAAREAIDRGDSGKAAADLSPIVEREPQNAEARYLLGRAQLGLAKYEEALKNFDEAIRLQPKMAEAILHAAAAEKALNEKNKADVRMEKYLEAVKPQPPAGK